MVSKIKTRFKLICGKITHRVFSADLPTFFRDNKLLKNNHGY